MAKTIFPLIPNQWSNLPLFLNRYGVHVLHFLSFVLLYGPCSIPWYFGNLSVYVNSYWYAKNDIISANSEFVISAHVITWALAVILAGSQVKKVDRRLLSFIGVVIFNAGFFLSAFTVDYSQIAFVFTLGAFSGTGLGFITVDVTTRVVALVEKRTGLAFGLVNSFFNLWAIVFDWISTLYINPNNKQASILLSNQFKVFGYKSLIDRVPNVFIILGFIILTAHSLGLILTLILKDRGLSRSCSVSYNIRRGDDKDDKVMINEVYVEANELTSLKIHNDKAKDMKRNPCCSSIDAFTLSPERNPAQYQHKLSTYSTAEDRWQSTVNQTIQTTSDGLKTECDQKDLNQFQILKTSNFYVLWFIVFANDYMFIVLLNFYKIFGEFWYHDDHFLTHLGIAFLCTVFITRLLWAFTFDLMNPKTSQIAITSLMVLTCSFYALTPYMSIWLFAVWTCVMASLSCTVYTNASFLAHRLFGNDHFAANYGMVSTSFLILNLIAPHVFNPILQLWGWFALFAATGALNAVALLAIVMFLPSTL